MRSKKKNRVLVSMVGAATGLLAAASPLIAHADTCPTPSINDCRDPAFYDTTCGAVQKSSTSTCATLIQNEFQANYGNLGVEQRVLPHTLTPVATLMDDSAKVVGMTFNATRNLYVNWLTTMRLSEVKGIPFTHATWDSNGPKVNSCEEFAFEANNDYSVFDQATAQYGSDYRSIFDTAFATGGIAYKTLLDKDNKPMGWPVWPGHSTGPATLPKNAYFAAYAVYNLTAAQYASAGLTGYDPFDSWQPTGWTMSTLQGQATRWSVYDWQFHDLENQLTAAMGVPDDVLNTIDEKKEAFSKLLADRQAAFERAKHEPDPVCGPNDWFCGRPSAIQTALLDQQIFIALNDAQTMGCLTADANKCDWSPRMFVKMLGAEASRHREDDFQKCMDYTGGDFTFARNSSGPIVHLGDNTTSPKVFRTLLANLQTLAQAPNDFPKIPGTNIPAALTDTAQDNGTFGNSDIGATWRYSMSWLVNGWEGANKACDAKASVRGEFHLTGHAYSFNQNLIDVTADAAADPKAASNQIVANLSLKVRDESIYEAHPKLSTTRSFNVVSSNHYTPSYTVPGPRISVFGITLGINAGVSADLGLDSSIQGTVGLGCASTGALQPVNISGTLTPSVDASIFAELTAGIPSIVEAGVKASLVLMKASLPLTASATITLTHNGPGFFAIANIAMSLKYTMQTLDGSISLFASFLDGWKHAEKTIFEWNGYRTDSTLFDFRSPSLPIHLIDIN